MFRKILIANRGEIACRVAATARRLGIQTVAVYSDADARARHVAACDEALHIGSSAPADSYLRGDAIVAAALACGAEAVHPGYGFLSENAAFAQSCADAGLVFIGPPPAAIRAMGLKAESKRLMEQAGVPLVPGYHGERQEDVLLLAEAELLGFPVLIKASAGGGGKGMRVVERAGDFAAALASCRREAASSFGNDAVIVEQYLVRPRHVEIQVFGDQHGNCVYLFERDCSVQRRHQKLLEEAPAPGMTPELRARMGLAAVAAAHAVGYVGAGTVEFIVAPHAGGAMPFYFMEMNTRLQVEHPVTEAITGLDLVEWQLRVAAGEPLPLRQEQIVLRGHAIEARLCAENPERDFLPATGTLAVYRTPACSRFAVSALRVDDGVREGDTLGPHYDSLLAKLIVHGDTREQALARLDLALAQTHVVGIRNNVQFLRRVVASASFAGARLDTALIERERAALFGPPPLGLPLAVAAAVAHQVLGELDAEGRDPFSKADGWRSHGGCTRRLAYDGPGGRLTAALDYRHDGSLFLTVGEGGTAVAGPLRCSALAAGEDWKLELEHAGRRGRASVYRLGEQLQVFMPQGAVELRCVDLLAHADDAAPGPGGSLTAPMPGRLLSFEVRAGEHVEPGQALAVLEAMKMEHSICAPAAGTVSELLHAPGDLVAEGEELLRLAPP